MHNLRPKTKACKSKVSPELQDYFDELYKFKDGYSQELLLSLHSRADHLAKFTTRKASVREVTKNSTVTQTEILPVAELLCGDGRICGKDNHLCSTVIQVFIVNCEGTYTVKRYESPPGVCQMPLRGLPESEEKDSLSLSLQMRHNVTLLHLAKSWYRAIITERDG